MPVVSEFSDLNETKTENKSAEAGTLKQWGGRFSAPTDPLVERFSGSVAVDGRLLVHDIAGSIAHAPCWAGRRSSLPLRRRRS